MNASQRIIGLAMGVTLFLPATAATQTPAAQPPVVHYITVTRMTLPDDTLDRQNVFMWIDSVMVPMNRLNSNIVSATVATHNWGANSREAVLMSEYATWAGIEADCKPCDDWFTAHQPKAGTPQRAKWDRAGEAFRKAFLGHRDEIYTYNVNRAKR